MTDKRNLRDPIFRDCHVSIISNNLKSVCENTRLSCSFPSIASRCQYRLRINSRALRSPWHGCANAFCVYINADPRKWQRGAAKIWKP